MGGSHIYPQRTAYGFRRGVRGYCRGTTIFGNKRDGRNYSTYTTPTDSQATMRRILCDSPGPGQALAIEGIRMSQAIRGRGSSVEVRWVPGHARVEGNETADLCASEAATWSRRNQPSKGDARVLSLAALKAEGTMKANKMWRGEIIRRKKGKRNFSCPKEGKRPQIRRDIGNAPKGIASRFYQLASGHAWLAPFLRERFGWVDSDTCWWCGSGRQTREHCFKECITWKDEIKTLW